MRTQLLYKNRGRVRKNIVQRLLDSLTQEQKEWLQREIALKVRDIIIGYYNPHDEEFEAVEVAERTAEYVYGRMEGVGIGLVCKLQNYNDEDGDFVSLWKDDFELYEDENKVKEKIEEMIKKTVAFEHFADKEGIKE